MHTRKNKKWIAALVLALCMVCLSAAALFAGCEQQGEFRLVYNSAESGVRAYDTVELGFDAGKTVENPYDPQSYAVDAVIELPGGGSVTAPMFWYVGYERSLKGDVEQLTPNGIERWTLRYTPTAAGEYTFRIRVTENGTARDTGTSVTVNVAPGNADAFLRVAEDKERLEFSNGKSFVGIGDNLCGWEWAGDDNQAGTYDYDRWMTSLKESGANMTQFDLSEGDNIEWTALENELPYSDGYGGIGRYNAQAAWKADYKVKLCEDLGLFFRFTLFHWEDFDIDSENFPDWGWKRNPYNAANGGPVDNVSEFFADDTARQYVKNFLRYCVARWGYSPNLMLWELWNEVDAADMVWAAGTSYATEESTIVDWHKEMASYLKSLDVNSHMVTTSYAWSGYGDPIWKLPEIDVTTFHRYTMYNDANEGPYESVNVLSGLITSRLFQYSKPVIAGEFAVSPGGDIQRENDHTGVGFHNQIWASLFAGSYGTAMHWTWGSYMDYFDLYWHYEPLANMLRQEDLTGLERANNIRGEEKALYMTMTGEDRAYAWIKDRDHDYRQVYQESYVPSVISGASVSFEGMQDGAYTAYFYDTWDPSADPTTADVTVSGGKATVSLPDFEKDIAVKLVAKSDDYTAIDISTDGKNNDSFVYGDSVWLYSMGAEIGGSGDAGRFVYRTIEGDFTLTARISRVGYLGSYSKAGLMVRQTQSPTSKMGFIGLNGRGEVSFISRNGIMASSTPWKEGFVGAYVRIERKGNTLTGYYSADGISFEETGSVTFSDLNDSLMVGFMANSRNTLGYNDALFERIEYQNG